MEIEINRMHHGLLHIFPIHGKDLHLWERFALTLKKPAWSTQLPDDIMIIIE
jgi:hypothetical protein